MSSAKIAVGIASLSACVALFWLWNFRTFGRPWLRRSIHENLCRPMRVAGVDGSCLRLASGETIAFRRPVADERVLALLELAVREGVERTEDGRTVGLMPVQSTCGNDPIGERVLRVDLDEVARFFAEGGANYRGEPEGFLRPPRVGKFGWLIGQHHQFTNWLAAQD